MFARRSLGDSPLEHKSNDVGLLDFIGKGSEPAVLALPALRTMEKDHNEHTDKKTVSYYLEDHLVTRVKALATLTERSYSSLASEALKILLQKYGF